MVQTYYWIEMLASKLHFEMKVPSRNSAQKKVKNITYILRCFDFHHGLSMKGKLVYLFYWFYLLKLFVLQIMWKFKTDFVSFFLEIVRKNCRVN